MGSFLQIVSSELDERSHRLLRCSYHIRAVPVNAKDTVHLALRRGRSGAKVRVHVFPDYVTIWRYFEEPAVKSLVDQGIAVGQTLRVRDPAAEEEMVAAGARAVLIFPHNLLGIGIYFEGTRKRLNAGVGTEWPIVKQQNVAVW